MKAKLFAVWLLVLLSASVAVAENPGYTSWIDYFRLQGATIKELPGTTGLIEIDHNGEKTYINIQIPESINNKNPAKYTDKTVFMVSDEYWTDILTFLPATIWRGNNADNQWCNKIFDTQDKNDFPYTQKCAYPLIVYHKEGNNYDLDSPLHFLEQYGADRIIHIGPYDSKLKKLLGASRGLLGLLPAKRALIETDTNQVLSYWNNYTELVFVEQEPSLAMPAAQYAAYINAPLVIDTVDSSLNNWKTFKNKTVICIGDASPVWANCSKRLSEKDLNDKLISLTGSDKALILNPNDINDEYCENLDFKTKEGKLSKLYCHDSLAATYLATAKEELIVPVDLEPSYGIGTVYWNYDLIRYINPTLLALCDSYGENYLYTLERLEHPTVDAIKDFKIMFFKNGEPLPTTHFSVQRFPKKTLYDVSGLTISGNLMYLVDWDDENSTKANMTIKIFKIPKDGFFYDWKQNTTPLQEFRDPSFNEIGGKIAVYGKRLYVPDKNDIKVFSLDKNGLISKLEQKFNGSESGGFNKPFAVIISSGTLYVSDTLNNRVQAFRLDNNGTIGKHRWTLDSFQAQNGTFKLPTGLAIRGDVLYVADMVHNRIIGFKLLNDSIEKIPSKIFGKGGDETGNFSGPYDILIHNDLLVVSDWFQHRIQILNLSDNPKHPWWTPFTKLGISPNNLFLKVATKVCSVFGGQDCREGTISENLKIPKYFTYFASPKALQFATDSETASIPSFETSIDFRLTEAMASGVISNQANDSNKQKQLGSSGDNNIKPYGRVFGLTVSDSSAYVARSVFADRIKPKRDAKIVILVGDRIEIPTYLSNEPNIWVWASQNTIIQPIIDYDASKGGTPLKDRSPFSTKMSSEIFKGNFNFKDKLTNTDLLILSIHGNPNSVGTIAGHGFTSKEILECDTDPMVVLASSCSNLAYYATFEQPTVGIAFMRSGAVEYLGAVCSAGNAYCNSDFYVPVKKLLTENPPVGDLITAPLAGCCLEEYQKDPYTYQLGEKTISICSLQKSYEAKYTLIGDPTYRFTSPVSTIPQVESISQVPIPRTRT